VVILLDVQAQADDLRVGRRQGLDVGIQGAKDAPAARLGTDVDALDPPDPAVAPVAPPARQHQLAHDTAGFLGDEVENR